MTECIFCKIARGEVPSAKVWENEKFFAFLDRNPIRKGHTLIIPKNHHEYLFDMDDSEYSDLMLASKSLAGAIQKAMGANKIGLLVEGFLVHHAHIHLVPLNKASDMNTSNATKANTEELNEVSKMISAQISS